MLFWRGGGVGEEKVTDARRFIPFPPLSRGTWTMQLHDSSKLWSSSAQTIQQEADPQEGKKGVS